MNRISILVVLLACSLGALAEAPRFAAMSPQRTASALAHDAAKAFFVDSNLSQARRDAASALSADPANLEALFVTMETAALQADPAAELDAAVKLCEAQVPDPRVEIAAARVLDLAANTSAFRAVAPRIRYLVKAESAQADFLRIALLVAAQDGLPGASVSELAHQAGFLTDWRLAGPFGRFSNVDFERSWPPERDALNRPVSGNAITEDVHFQDGNVTLPENFARGGVYYASAQATISASGEWVVRAESAGTLAVFLDGKQALTRDDRFRSHPAIASARVKLEAGRHTVVVKFLASASPFRIAVVRPHYPAASDAALASSRQEQAYVQAAQRYWTADYAGALASLSPYSHPSAAIALLQAQAWAHLDSSAPEEISSLNAALAAAPDASAADAMLAERYYSEDRLDDALPRVLRVVAARADFAPAQELRYELAVHMHWQAEAADAITALMRLHPACSVLRDASAFFRSASQYQRAAEADAALHGCVPDSPAAKPTRVEDSAHTRAIDPAEAFYTSFRRDGPQLVRAAASRLFSGGPALVLLDARVLRLHLDGRADLYVHKLTRVLDHEGIERNGEVAIPTGSDLLELRTLTPDGIVAGEPELDNRKATISMAGLAPGNVIEQEYVTHFPADPARSFSYQFGSFEAPILFARFAVISPANLPQKISAVGAPDATFSRLDLEEVRVWERNDIAQSVEEAAMPRIGQLPEVVVNMSGVSDWSEVRRYYRDAIIESTRAGERVAEFASQLPGATPDDKAHALYHALTSKVRAGSHSLEQGLTPAEETLSTRQGSRTAAFLATARMLGIPAELVLAREMGSPVPQQPALKAYTHPLVRMRLRASNGTETHAVVDVESDRLPFGSLPPSFDRSRALLVPIEPPIASEPLFISLPGGSDSERSVADGDLAFDRDGNLSARLRITLGTWRGSQVRSILRGIAPGGRQRFFEQLATRIFPGAVDVSGEAVNENDPERPLQLQVRCRVLHFLSFNNGFAELDQIAPALGLRKMYIRDGERRFPLYLDSPFFEITRFQIHLPDNMRIARLASDFDAQQRFGSYAVRFREFSPREFEVTRSFRFPVQVIAPAEYPEFARFATRIEDAERQRLTLERAEVSAKK